VARELMAWATPTPWPSMLPPGQAPIDVSIWPYLLQLVVVTAVVAVLGFFGARYWRERIPGLLLRGRERPVIQVVDRHALDATRSLMVVRVGGRYWLLASAGDRLTPVAELQPEDVLGTFSEHLVKEQDVSDEA
jgi:hypothetical protein